MIMEIELMSYLMEYYCFRSNIGLVNRITLRLFNLITIFNSFFGTMKRKTVVVGLGQDKFP